MDLAFAWATAMAEEFAITIPILMTAGTGHQESQPIPSPLLQFSSNPLAVTVFGAIVTLFFARLSTKCGEDMMETAHLISIHILAFSILGIFFFCTSQASPILLCNHPVIAGCFELVGILSVGLFLSSLVSIALFPRYRWLVYTFGLLSLLPLLHKPGQLVYRCLSQRLVSTYRLLMLRFYPAKETEVGIV